MKKYFVSASLYNHSCEFEIEAENLGEALKKADDEFRVIYMTANGYELSRPLMTWGDRKMKVKEIK